MSRRSSIKIVDNNNYRQSQIAYILENDNVSVCKPFSKHSHPSLSQQNQKFTKLWQIQNMRLLTHNSFQEH